jgi:hypothetical protein
MPEPNQPSQDSFRAFLAAQPDLDAEIEFAKFLKGGIDGWVQHAGAWARRSEHPEKPRRA